MSKTPKKFGHYCTGKRAAAIQVKACFQILIAMSVNETTKLLIDVSVKERIDLFRHLRWWAVAKGEHVPEEFDTDEATRTRFFAQIMLTAPAAKNLLMSVFEVEKVDMLHYLVPWQVAKVSKLESESGTVTGAKAAESLHVQLVRAQGLLLMLKGVDMEFGGK